MLQESKDEHRRKEKKKKKDKDREKERDKDKERDKVEGHTAIPRMVVKGLTPAGSPTREGTLKLKIKLGGTPAVE